MATFFGRRYMRDQVPRTEVMVGLAVLLVLGGMVAAAVTAGKWPQASLFELGVEHKSALSREQQIARHLMPGLGTAGWSLPGEIEVLDRTAMESAGESELLEAGAAWLYRGVYANSATGESVSVEIVDAQTPAYAFGIYKQGKPGDAAPLAVGNEGWQSGRRGAFWAGRHYTQFDRSNVQFDAPSARIIADALGSVQIAYGTPFWAEAVFPPDGRLQDGLAFVKRHAAGFDRLGDAFVASYESGATAFAAEAGSNRQAAELLHEFEALLSEQGRVQSSPSGSEASILAGDLDGRQLAVFYAGNRVYGAVGGQMDAVSGLARQMLDTVQPPGVAAGATPVAEVRAPPFPPIKLPEWEAPADFSEYTPLNLWEKINGRAEIYLQFDMQRMTLGTYRHRTEPSLSVDVYWYRMADATGAFGIYRAEAGGDPTQVPVGTEGYAVGGSVIFRKGRDYVRVEAAGEGEALAAAGMAIAEAVAERIEDTGESLWAESLLPQEGRVSAELAYHRANAFSLDFLGDVFSADYAVEGRTFTAFIHRAADPAEPGKLLDAYEGFFKDYGRVIERAEADGVEILVGESGGVVDAAFAAGVYLGGVNNADDAAFAKEQALAFARALVRGDASKVEGADEE